MFDDNKTKKEIRLAETNMVALNFASQVMRFVLGNPAAEFKYVTCEFMRKDTSTTDRAGVSVKGRFQISGLPVKPEIHIFFALICYECEWQLNGSDAQIMFEGVTLCVRRSYPRGFEAGNRESKVVLEDIRKRFGV